MSCDVMLFNIVWFNLYKFLLLFFLDVIKLLFFNIFIWWFNVGWEKEKCCNKL